MKKINETYPKSWKKLKEYLNEEIQKLVARWKETMPQDADVEVPNPPPMSDIAAEGMIQYYPRRLYDFFDANKVILYVQMGGAGWVCLFDGDEAHGAWGSRTEAETAGFYQCFNIMEEKL